MNPKLPFYRTTQKQAEQTRAPKTNIYRTINQENKTKHQKTEKKDRNMERIQKEQGSHAHTPHSNYSGYFKKLKSHTDPL